MLKFTFLLLLPLLAALTACGASTNVLGLLAPQDEKDSFANQLSVASAAYDRGDMPTALKYAQAAFNEDNSSEAAAVLYGYINLSLAGTDPFELAKAIIANQEASTAASTTNGTADELNSLKSVIGLPPADLASMGTLDTSDPTLPILIPKCVEDVRSAVDRLQYLDHAIRAICPFIGAAAKVSGDARQDCVGFPADYDQLASADFLWAFSHLTEALAFDSVLTYGTADPTGKESNLELRVAKIQGQNIATVGVSTLVSEVQSINTTLQAVLPTSGQCSPTAPTTQLKATVNDMLTVDAAFGAIPGAPQSIRTAIQAAISTLQTPQAVSTGGSADAQSQALKGDLTQGLSKNLAATLDALSSNSSTPLPAAQKAALCASFASIAAGSGQASTLCGAASGTASGT